jgi:hypothetical protein
MKRPFPSYSKTEKPVMILRVVSLPRVIISSVLGEADVERY